MERIKQTSDHILSIILLFIFVFILSGGIYYSYIKIMVVTDYLVNKLIMDIQTVSTNAIDTKYISISND